TAQWDGVVAGNLSLTYNGGIGGNFETTGCSYNLTANQTGSVLIRSAVSASANLAADHITNSSPAGTLQLGDGTANVLNIIWRADGGSPVNGFYQPHFLLNNSSSPNIICPNVRFQAGGGNQHILRFGGSGDWIITNNLATANGVGTSIVKQDAGTLIWAGPSIAGALGNSVINTPVDIEGGTLILRSSGVLGTQRITNNATLRYDAVASQTLSGPIDGSGLLMVSAGTLTLSSGISDFSGNIILTNGGTLVAGGNQNVGGNGALGTNGAILFNGGTLQFSAANTFDYSPRFSTAAGQAYSINSGGQNVTFTNDLTSSGATFTKAGSGTLTLAGTSSYSGLTTVSAGKLVFQGMKTGSGNITVANSTSLGVTTTGTQVTPNTLTVGTSSSATLEFNSVSSTTTALIAAGTVSAGGTITVNVNSGSFTIGQDYPLFSWSSGSAPAVTLGTLTGAGGNLITNGSAIKLHITSLAFVWTGLTDGNWDTTTANDWKVNGVSQVFNNGGTALFDDTATGQTNITLNAAVSPASVTVNSTTHPYSITSGGANLIGGSGGLTKNGNSTLTLSGGVNTYSGATTISGGTLSLSTLANGGTASDIGAAGSGAANLVLNGGTLLYTGGAQDCDHLFTLGTGNGAINSSGSGALNLNNGGVVVLSGSGARALTLSGTDTDDNTLSAVLGDNGGATSLAKTGAGKWVLTGNNTNSGTVTISAGTLQVGTNGPGASLGTGNIVDNGSLIFNNSDTLTNGTVSGTGTVTVNGDGTVVLPGDNTYSGAAGTVINNGTLQVGIGGATGKLTGTLPIVDNGTIILNSTGSLNIGGFSAIISGSGNLIKRGSGLLAIIGNNNYSGWTTIDAGAQLQVCDGNQGQFASSVVTNSGSLIMDRQDNNTFFFAGNIVGTGSL
ncbi:MAG: autotransporter-associated beta strand repeat-containing protein, partial [Verrucomicrobia bacterium]|nr:autotransporter-associated beta strand repeat-containing protein [Verrucomicrobiota bacterium]